MNDKKEVKLINKVKRLLKRFSCPRWLHYFGPKTYEFYQHITALLLKEVFKLSFRRVSNLLNMLGLVVPSYSALCKMRKRISLSIWEGILSITTSFSSYIVAIDSTGLSRTNPSWHYINRINSKNPVKSYVKLSCFFDTRRKKFLALRIRARPRHDSKDVHYLLKQRRNMKKLVGDTSYDAEWIHELCDKLNITTVIKPRKNVRRGYYRRKQKEHYSEKTYHRRSMIESGFGSLKRKYGSYLLARAITSQRAEIYCRAIAHNIGLRYYRFSTAPLN